MTLINVLELRKIAKRLKIKDYENYTKKDLTKKILEILESKKESKKEKYIIKEQIGNKGKDGITFLAIDKTFDTEYAMKSFRKNKSSEKIMNEVRFQRICSEGTISPKIVDFDIDDEKIIVMEKMDWHLTDEINHNQGLISESRQKELINIFKKLDKLKIFHGDANLLNYMVKDDKLYIIDFGMAQEIDEKLKTKLKSQHPNLHIMLLGFILKLKESKCPEESYSILKTYLRDEDSKII